MAVFTLEMKCQYCGKYAGYPVIKTESGNYQWGDDTTYLFMRIVGKELSYRIGIKRCISCSRQFNSIEMTQDY